MNYEVHDITGEILSEKKNEAKTKKKKQLKLIQMCVCFNDK